MKRILVPTDFSNYADRALTVAIEFAKPLGATIALVHVYASSPRFSSQWRWQDFEVDDASLRVRRQRGD